MLNAYTYRLPFKQDFQSAGHRFTHREGIILVFRENGLEAYGEIAPLPGFSSETLSQVKDVLRINQEYLQNSISSGDGNEALRLLEMIHQFPSLSFGLDTLLHDLDAKQKEQPLVQSLFPERQALVSSNATLPIQDEDTLLSIAQKLVDDGFQTLKVKVGQDFQREQRVLEKLRKGFPDINIRIDANQAWSVDQAIENLNKLNPLQIEYCEQPVSAEDTEGLKKVKEAVHISIAADESIRNKSAAFNLSVDKVVDILVLKPMLMGTFENIFVTNEIAATHNIETVYTTSLESAVGRAAIAAISAGLKSAHRAQGLSTGVLLKKDVSIENWLNSADIHFPDSSGLGISLNLKDLKKLF